MYFTVLINVAYSTKRIVAIQHGLMYVCIVGLCCAVSYARAIKMILNGIQSSLNITELTTLDNIQSVQ